MESFGSTDKLQNVISSIRGSIYQEALRLQAQGEEILKLNTGNPPNFGFGLPESCRNALMQGIDRAVAYSDLKGMDDARDAIRQYHRSAGITDASADNVYIGNGVSELAEKVLLSFLNYGDEFLIPSPSYSLWTNCTYIAGAKPVFYSCRAENGWMPDLSDIRSKVTPKTRAILVISPNNPTGAVYSAEILSGIVQIAREFNLAIFSDEIYDRLLLDDASHISIASLCPDLLTVTLNGLSKSHMICGFRCGWALINGPKKYTAGFCDGMTKLCAMRLCSNTLAQLVIPAALADTASTKAHLVKGGRLFEQREATCNTLDKIDGISYVKNRAAFYLFPKLDKEKFNIKDDRRFALDFLHAKHVLIIPGSGFDWLQNDHFRIVMLPQKEILQKAMEDLGDFLSDYRQK